MLSLAPALFAWRNDFLNYHLPARARWEGRPLDRAYERLWMAREADQAGLRFVGLFMPNPPPNALLLLPLGGLPPPAAKPVWTVLLAAGLLAAFEVTRRLLPGVPGWWIALAFLLPTTALANALAYGPPYALLVLLVALALLAASRGREWTSGLLLAPVVALKLYALVLLPYFVWTRRWRAAAGLVIGTAAIAAASVLLLGPAVHATYLREMLPASLDGRIIDPYSPFWQTLPAVARRLFQLEPELNPLPVADHPVLAAFLPRFAAAAVLLATVLAARRDADGPAVKREWAALLLASLAVSPMTASYHLVLLAVPCAVLLADPRLGWRRAAVVLGLLAFAASPLPHRFTPLAAGWGNLLACPRLWALLALWAVAVAPLMRARVAALAAAGALLAGASALVREEGPPPGARLDAARGVLLSEPVECAGAAHWVAPEQDRYVVVDGAGARRAGDTARCIDGRLLAGTEVVAAAVGVPATAALVDADRAGDLIVVADPARGELRERTSAGGERVLARGLVARPRVSRDGRWIVFQAWARGSWDVRALERASGRVLTVAASPANETEPSWSEDGGRVLLASDWRRGLFGPALYSVPFVP